MDGKKYSARSDGAYSLLFGVIAAYFCAYRPVVDVMQGQKVVQVYGIAFLLLPLVLVQGAIYLILGPKAEDLFGDLRSPNAAPKRAGLVLRGILIVVGVLFFLWFESIRLQAGYR